MSAPNSPNIDPSTSVVPVAKPIFSLPDPLLAAAHGSNPATNPAVSSDARPSQSETVEPKTPACAGLTEFAGQFASQLHSSVVSNATFLATIFSAMPKGTSALVCSKDNDPTTGPWIAKPTALVQATCLPSKNNYFNCSSYRTDADGTWKSRKDNLAAFHCLLLDDVGTKVAFEQLNGFNASWAIETSPGNYQIGFILAQPLKSADEVTRLQNAVIARGLCDPGATGATRWARLPVGVNGKAKYASAKGQPFQCRLMRWRPELRYTFDEMVAGLQLNMEPVKTPIQHVSQDARPAFEGTVTKEINAADAAKLPSLLEAIDPDCARPDWVRVLMAVFHTTGGSDAGFDLVNSWSSKGKKYKGVKELEIQWRSFRGNVQRPVTIGTLIMMARDAGACVKVIAAAGESFEPCETVTVASTPQLPDSPPTARDLCITNPLTRYSLRDSLAELEKQKVDQVLIFGQLVLQGQATVIYALANTGKTLILIHLIVQAIQNGLIDPANLYYINMDDNSSGLVEKVRIFSEYGCHMIADGHKDFAAKEFRASMVKMIETNTARGAIVVLDTLKKFVNTMNKEHSADFARVVRQFSLKGGTVIALSHANKNPGSDGKIKYTGTTDIVDDFDSVYTLQTVSEQPDDNQKVVEFTNIKRRGDVALTAAYSYALERGLSYSELLLSVTELDPNQVQPIKQAAELKSDAVLIAAIEACIAADITTKMKLAHAVSKAASVSNRIALNVIDKYTGNDPGIHRWSSSVRARGAQVFELIERPGVATAVRIQPSTPIDGCVTVLQHSRVVPALSMDVAAAIAADLDIHAQLLREGTLLLLGEQAFTPSTSEDDGY